MCKLVKDFVRIDNYTKIKIFVDEKREHIDNKKNFIVVSEFDYKQSLELIILYVKAVLSKMNFDFLIDTFVLIIDFEMSNGEEITLNVETFAKEFLYKNDELKITIKRY